MIRAESPYPISINGLFLPILSLQKPERDFIKAAVLSAMPSIRDRLVLEAPKESRNMGITEYTILVEVSVSRLVNPVKKTFLLTPKNLLSLIGSSLSSIL